LKNSISQAFITAVFESILVVLSILLALWLDERQNDQESQELAVRSLENFSIELAQNKSRVEFVSTTHQALGQLLEERSKTGEPTTIVEYRGYLDFMDSIALTSNAWDTAVAAGALTSLDYSLVAALSLTYNTQTRFDTTYNSTLQELLSPGNMTEQNLEITIYSLSRFATDMARSEIELGFYYEEALTRLAEYNTEAN